MLAAAIARRAWCCRGVIALLLLPSLRSPCRCCLSLIPPLSGNHEAVALIAKAPLPRGKTGGDERQCQILAESKTRAEKVAATLCDTHVLDAQVWAEEVASNKEALRRRLCGRISEGTTSRRAPRRTTDLAWVLVGVGAGRWFTLFDVVAPPLRSPALLHHHDTFALAAVVRSLRSRGRKRGQRL